MDFVRQNSKESLPDNLDDAIKKPLKAEFAGKPISFLDDIPFTIDDVKDVQIALTARAAPDETGSSRVLNQPVGIQVPGRVVSGRHEAVIQVSGMSAQSFREITSDLRTSLVNQPVKIANGAAQDYQGIKILDIGQPTVVVTVKASADAGNTPDEHAQSNGEPPSAGKQGEALLQSAHRPGCPQIPAGSLRRVSESRQTAQGERRNRNRAAHPRSSAPQKVTARSHVTGPRLGKNRRRFGGYFEEHRLAGQIALQLLDHQLPEATALVVQRSADMRGEDNVRQIVKG